jgi:succinate dehydrogenase / fumarate reductase cytochrome b subunit
MSTEAVATAPQAQVSHTDWLAKKIHSFVGVVPLGVYVVLHLSRNVSSLAGPKVFDNAIRQTWTHPINYVWVVLLVYLPLIFHAGWGLKLVWESEKTNVFRNFNLANLRYFFQRLSGLGVLAFLFAHIFLTRVQVSMGWLQDANINPGGQVTYDYFATHMTDWSKGTAIVYILGILGTVYHLANGLTTFGISWGITTGAKSIKRAEILALVFGLLLLALGYATILGFFLYPFKEFVTPHGPLSPTGILGPFMHYKT